MATNEKSAKSTPTPGPWVPKRDTGLRWRIQTSGDKGTLAYMTARPAAWSGNFSHAQIEANARLIAAAPEMLKALEDFVKAEESFLSSVKPGTIDDHLSDAYKRAREAIKKARGE